MTTKEFKLLISILKAAYTSPNFLPDEYTIKVYYIALKDLPYETLNYAIQYHIATNKFPPTIAELRELCSPRIPDWSEAWHEVKRAIAKYGANREKEALESMSPMTKTIVQRLGFREICLSENTIADRANFRIVYEHESENTKKEVMLPNAIKERLCEMFTLNSPE